MLFLKYLDDLEYEKSLEAELLGKDYSYIIDAPHRWGSWAAPKDAAGNFDHNTALTGTDLIEYVDGELFPYLKAFKQKADNPNTIEYKIGEIFGEIKNKLQGGYSLRDALEKVDELRFRSQEEKYELSHLYESKIKNMGNAGRNGGEYYTPRPLIRAMIKVVNPQIGESIYDGAAGSAASFGEDYSYIIDAPHRWGSWAAPKDAAGNFDHNTALTGTDLIEYVDGELFPYLKAFKQKADNPNTIEYKIGEIFGEIKNKLQGGYSLRDALEKVDELRFRSQEEKYELSHLYESKIKNMGNAGRNGGEYYTPRPLIRAMIKVVNPQIGESIYDGAAGSAGFLCESFDYLRKRDDLSTSDLKTLQESTFYAQEKKSLAYVIAIMNMILHGIEAPNVLHTNTLAEDLANIQQSDRHDIILANPPFGGKERKEVQQNFPIKTGETAFLFLQHFIKKLKAGGRAAIVIKNTFLSNTDNAAIALRKELLENCSLHTILDCPAKTFLGAGVKTVVLIFEKGSPTQKVWYYQLDPGRSLGKTNPLNDDDLKEFVELQKSYADSDQSWSVDTGEIDTTTWDLSVKSPNGEDEVVLREPALIIKEIITLDKESEEMLGRISGLLR